MVAHAVLDTARRILQLKAKAQLAMGDALAVCRMECRGFGPGEFSRFHPGGTLRKKLYLYVANLCFHNEKPSVAAQTPIQDVICEITRRRLGCTAIQRQDGSILGIITIGDLRRLMEKRMTSQELQAKNIMNPNPRTIEKDTLQSRPSSSYVKIISQSCSLPIRADTTATSTCTTSSGKG